MKKFKEGDRVRHKSRTGSYMGVKGYSSTTGEVICKWFDDDKKKWEEEFFEEEELELAKAGVVVRAKGFKT